MTVSLCVPLICRKPAGGDVIEATFDIRGRSFDFKAGQYISLGLPMLDSHSPTEATIEIRDEGVGIPENELPNLFQKFRRVSNPLSRSVNGSGLGLYWVKRIIDLHGGTIAVASAVGEGTTFTIKLPIE